MAVRVIGTDASYASKLVFEALASRLHQELAQDKMLVAAMRDRIDRAASAAWPGVELDRAEFAVYLIARAPRSARELAHWAVEDLYLCCACSKGDPAAIVAFTEQFWSVVSATLVQLRVGTALAEDAQQELRERLFVGAAGRAPAVASFAGVGSLAAWLKVVTVRHARRVLAREKRLVPTGDAPLERLALGATGDELSFLKNELGVAFKKAFKSALGTLDGADLTLLQQRYVDGVVLEQLGRLYRVHASTIQRRLQRAQRLLLERTQGLLAAALGVTSAECESLLDLVRTRLDITLQTFLDGQLG